MADRQVLHRGKTLVYDDDLLTEEEAIRLYDQRNPEVPEEQKYIAKDTVVDTTTESEGTLQEFSEGLGSGVSKAVQGVAEVGAGIIDFAFDTNYVRSVSEAGDAFREAAGLDPVGIAGTLGDVTGQFLLPGGLAVGAVSKFSKLGKLNKAINEQGRGRMAAAGPMPANLTRAQKTGLHLQQAGAAMVADAMVAHDGTTTIGDFVEGGPTMTEADIGLSGREEVYRRARNKARLGVEAGALAFAFPYLLSTTALASKPFVYVTGEALAPVAGTTRAALQKISQTVGDSETVKSLSEITIPRPLTALARADADSTIGDAFEGVKASLRFRGNLSQENAEVRSQIQGFIDRQANAAAYTVKELEDGIKKVFKGAKSVELDGYGPLTRVEAMNAIYGFLTKDESFLKGQLVRRVALRRALQGEEAFDPNNVEHLLEALPEFARAPAMQMRKQIDNLSARVLNSDYGTQNISDQIREQILGNLGKYMRRKYRVFDDPEAYFKSAQYKKNRQEVFRYFQQNQDAARDVYNKIISRNGELGEEIAAGAQVTPRAINEMIETFVSKYRNREGFMRGGKNLSRVVQQRMNTTMFAPRKLEEEQLRKLLGEITDSPAEAYVKTVGELAETIAVDNFYGFMRQNRGRIENGARVGGDDIVDGTVYDRLSITEKNNYQILSEAEAGTGFGSLRSEPPTVTQADGTTVRTAPELRIYARKPVFRDLTRSTRQFEALNIPVNAMLLGKGFTQKVKTVYSLTTQIRNVTSAALFAAAQGNIGRGANVWESVSLVMENIKKSSPEDRAAFFQELQELGVVGTQAQLRELERSIDDGLNQFFGGKQEIDEFGVFLGQSKARSKGMQFLSSTVGKVDKRLRDFYQGGDDIWKIYNFDFERSKIINAFGGDINRAEEFARSQGFRGDNALNQYAADIVKNTVPNYERVPALVEGLRRLPIGNFVAFPAEIIRTSFNTLNRSIDEVQRGKQMMNEAGTELRRLQQLDAASDEVQQGMAQAIAQREAGQKIRDIGKRRLTGFAATTMVVGPAAQQAAILAYDLSQDSIDALREIAPPWSKNSTLVPTTVVKGKDGKNKITGYVDFSYINPYDYLRRPVAAVMNAVERGEELNLDRSTIVYDALSGVLTEMLSPFAEESIIVERLADVTVRGGVTRTGSKVYKSQDTVGEVGLKSAAHVFDAFQPTITRDFAQIAGVDPVTQEIELIVPGRLGAALFSEDGIDRRGNVRQLAEELVRQFSGIGEAKVTPEIAMSYRVREHNKDAREPQQNFNSTLSNFAKTIEDPSVLFDVYRRENERKIKIYNRAFRLIQNMRKLGMSDDEIRKVAKKEKFAGYKEVMRGAFDPVNIDPNKMDDIENFYRTIGRSSDFNRRDVLLELQRIESEYRNKSLTAEGAPEFFQRQRNMSFRIEPPVDDAPQEQVQPAAPTPPTAAVETGAVSNLPSTAPVQPATPVETSQSTIQDPRTRELFERLRGAG